MCAWLGNPHGIFEKEDLEEILQVALEMRRRVKEQLKTLGGIEFYDVNFSYIDNETFEEHYVFCNIIFYSSAEDAGFKALGVE